METNINLKDNTETVHIYGGESWIDDIEFTDYGIQIGDLSIDLNKETALDLCRKLKCHLEVNFNKI